MAESGSARQATDRARDVATEWAFVAGWQIVRRLPERSAYAAFDRAAEMLWRRDGEGVRQLARNLARVRPEASAGEISELSLAAMRSYLRYWCDAFRLPTWSDQRIREGFVLDRHELLDNAVASGDGALMVVNHAGNWDTAAAWACLRYGGLTTVAERLRPEGLYQRFVAYRSAFGMEILPTGEPDVVRTLARRLREGRLVPLMGDRDIGRAGVTVDLFGEPASFPAGPALLAELTNAALHPVTMWFDGPIARGRVHDRVPPASGADRAERIRATTQAVADAFSVGIREHPVDWHMMQPVWLADLDPVRLAARAEAASESASESAS